MNQSELASAMDVLPQDITNWKRRGMPAERHRRAAEVLGCSVDELLGIAEVRTPVTKVAQSVSFESLTVVPVVEWGDLVNMDLPEVFKVAMPDESMAPKLRKGQFVECTRGIEARPGDGVLVCDLDGHFYLRIYRERRPGEWTAHATNPAFEDLDSKREMLSIIAVVTATPGRWS